MTPIIELSHVTYSYPNSDTPALKDLSLTINQGEWVAIIGHNGSGKSTLAKLLNYLLAPTAGDITIAGTPVTEENMWAIRDMVGMVFQNPDNQFVGATVADDVAFGLENRGIAREEMITRVQAALTEVQMAAFADREPARLSGGQKQRVAIASVLAIQPKILILDEATAMLDPKGRREMIALVHELKTRMGDELTVLSITHDIEEAASADRVVVINDGDLIETGAPAQVFANADKLREFGLAVPFAEQLKEKLRERGIDVPASYLTTEGMVDWLWQSISTK
ncbi:energy-coupling factor ABC transporter ATP-binding protein [Weissella cibaria]|jgi:ABC-type cobalt transport system, ATPase component|uniref:energy-coupling factor ABC transporter ATP-binding protein n=1 Tax=Weissella TaxID=46255 RepID=UPI0002192348|nr:MULTISPECIES: energy-coupling factor ABC transporter ATP-binding protein [Weissella]APS26887.1 Energy-coupling factor transporter ATP-binding protein EcfA1 [Weissella cibaria]APU62284.1 Energy-coupling factor transporter ATP-binding protein EcfA1 [Weissella cibaria]APU64436.1 Energy-coupling factor transporter ATP-binding protein EcfA1 [Weissella cibaria]ASS52182.1 Energy-coupling factor transporter ATP-binding protein EcfA1 [Weissella cibaria]KXU09989.1 ATPase component of general energizi